MPVFFRDTQVTIVIHPFEAHKSLVWIGHAESLFLMGIYVTLSIS